MRHLGMKTALVLAVMATGCVTDERVEVQLCPEGSLKAEPGVCGCDVEDVDGDGDTIMDCVDLCPEDQNKKAPGTCGCGVPDTDTDGDTVPDCFDLCPEDQNKKDPGTCGCGVPDTDTDGDTVPDCFDLCPEDPNKKAPGTCGCGMPDIDTDGDTVPDCLDKCPEDPNKTLAGLCGCGVVDTPEGTLDSDGDGVIDCLDGCPNNPYKTAPGSSTCEDRDTDGDGVEDALDDCPYNPTIQKLAEGGSCNFKTETIENGETIDVFEVWSAYDLVELRKYLETSPLGMENSRCEVGKLICGPAPYTAYYCPVGLSRKTMCYGGCSVDGEETVCKRCKETTATLEIGECCTSTDSTFVCTSDKKYKTCEKIDGVAQIVEHECKNGYACIEGEGGGKASCKAMEVAEGALTTGGNAGDDCNSSQYESTCTSETQMLVCLDGKVAIETVEYCKEDASTGWRIALPLIAPTYKLRVKLMQDIELADALPIVEKESAQCAADWTPMTINHVDFDGQGHTIYLSKHRSECMLNDSLFTSVSQSRVSNLNLSYNIGGQSVSVLSIEIVDSIIEHLSYRGERRSTYPLFSESRIMDGNPLFTSTLSNSIESSRVEDVKFDIPVLHSSEFSHKVTSSLLKDIAIKVGKQYCDSSISIDSKCHIIDSLNRSPLINVSYDIDRLDFASSSTGIIDGWSMLPSVEHALFENLSLKISSIDLSHVETITQFNIVSFSSVMNVDGMHIELGDIVDGKTLSDLRVINTFNGINVSNSPSRVLNDVTFNAGRIQAKRISLLKQPKAKLTKSTFKTGDIDSDLFVLFNFEKPEEKTEVEGLSVEIGNIKSESRTVLFDGNNYTIDQLNVKAGVIEAPVYVMMNENTKTTLKHADLSFDEIHSIGQADLLSYRGTGDFTGEDISISAKKVTSEKVVGFNDKMVDSKIQGLRIDIGEINAGSFAGLGSIQDSALTNIAVRVDRVVTKDNLYLISEFTDSEMTNGSFYGNLYGRVENTFPFVREWVKDNGNPKMENVVSSMSAYTYTANAETGAMENIEPVVNSVFLNVFNTTTPETPDDAPVAANVYWLKRVAAAKPFSSSDYAGFIPYYMDKTIDANGKTTQDVVTALGANWEILSATEDGATIEIPWLKKPSAATHEP